MIELMTGKGDYIELKTWKFPAGETGIKIVDTDTVLLADSTLVVLNFEGNDDLINMMLLVNAIRQIDPYKEINLDIPYFPYARQDRVCADGESFSLQVIANIINNLNFKHIEVADPHSGVLDSFFNPGILIKNEQCEVLSGFIDSRIEKFKSSVSMYKKPRVALVSPDLGATKKIYALAKMFNLEVLEAYKVRNVETGKIESTKLLFNPVEYEDYELIVVDDICDGGRTFIGLAEEINKSFKGTLTLAVTHGIFSAGLEALEKYYDEIYCFNNMRKTCPF